MGVLARYYGRGKGLVKVVTARQTLLLLTLTTANGQRQNPQLAVQEGIFAKRVSIYYEKIIYDIIVTSTAFFTISY
jgi:hypothetical protein